MSILNCKIDVRERDLRHLIEKSKILSERTLYEALDIGDIVFEKEGEIILILERKTATDLSSSICDGRYKEQKSRLIASGIDRRRIMYLIEGDFKRSNSSIRVKGGADTLMGCLINTLLRDGINVFRTASLEESLLVLEKMYKKLDDPSDLSYIFCSTPKVTTSQIIENTDVTENVTENVKDMNSYASSIKIKKRDNMIPSVWYTASLMMIPNLTKPIADIIVKSYPSIKLLINTYDDLETDSQKEKMLSVLEYISNNGKKRKIGPAVSAKVYRNISSL